MKDGRTHLAHKAEHAVDVDSGALVAVTLQDADRGDTTTIVETAIAAAEQVEAAQAKTDEPALLKEIVADKGYHSNETLVDLAAMGIRSYISEPDRGRAIGRTRRPRKPPSMRTGAGSEAPVEAACDGDGRKSPSDPLRTYMRPGQCAARLCVDTTTF